MVPLSGKALIIDDERDGRNIIAFLLKEHFPGMIVAGQAGHVAEATSMIHFLKPDLVFLDVEMPDGNAFDVLSACPDWNGQVILVTAHDHYAIRAIKNSVLDYLLKPVDEDEFIVAVKRALDSKPDKNYQGATSLLSDVYKHLMVRKIRIPTLTGFILADIDHILRCEASGNYSTLFFADGRSVTVSRKLGDYEDELNGYGFARIHHKHLINVNYIIEYHKGKSGGGFVTMQGHAVLEVSARRKKDLLDMLT